MLCDFGLSRIRHEITRTHTNIRDGGRSRFLAPELSSGPDTFRTSQESDIYSLAMTFLNLCTRNHPFSECARELEAVRAAEQGIRPIRPATLPFPQSVADDFWELLRGMWAHAPADRLTIHQVKDRVHVLFTDGGTLEETVS